MRRREFLATASGIGSVAAAASASSAAAQEGTTTTESSPNGTETANGTTTSNGTTTGNGSTSGGGGGGGGGKSHTVNMTDGLKFDPAEITIAPGDTVVWKNAGSIAHSVTAYEDEIPEGATYFASGGFDSESAARSGFPSKGSVAGGESFEHTFQKTGTFKYFCIPHEAAGMKGSVTVEKGGAAGGESKLDVEEMGVPLRAHYVGIATITSIVLTLVFSFFTLKYGESPNASSPNRK